MRSKPFPDHVIRAQREHVCARNSSDQGLLRSGHLDLGTAQTFAQHQVRINENCMYGHTFNLLYRDWIVEKLANNNTSTEVKMNVQPSFSEAAALQS